MRVWATRAAFATAIWLLAAPTPGLSQTARFSASASSPDPLRAVIFAGQDAVIDLGPIVPTPVAPRPSAPPAPRPAVAPGPAPARFTVTRIAADGARETRAIDPVELQALGRPVTALPARKPPVGDHRSVRFAASPPSVPAPATPQPSALRSGWTAAAPPPATAASAQDDASDAPDAVSPLVVRSQAASKKKSRDAAAFGVHDGRRYGEQGRFYIFAGGKGGGIGLNLVDHGDAWGSDGVSWDRGGFVGQRSAGIGWRKGDVTTSLGWAHEKNRVKGFFGFPSEKDERVALNLTWRPSPK